MATNDGGTAGNAPAAQQQTWGQMLKGLLFQMLIIYFITSYFRGGSKQAQTEDGKPAVAARNLFHNNEKMHLYMYLTESEVFNWTTDSDKLIWSEELKYASWTDGPQKDGGRVISITHPVPEAVQHNGSWHSHVYLVRSGYTINPEDDSYSNLTFVHMHKMFNRYRKRQLHSTANLLTGEADVAPGAIKVSEQNKDELPEVISYWHPNLTINVVYDQTMYPKGAIPAPLSDYINFTEDGTGYYPILLINDYWNLYQEYMPLNDTLKEVTLHLTYTPLSFFRFQMYASVMKENPWSQWMGQPSHNDEEQDTVKQTLLDTNPYLLGLTVVVSIVHSVFEFLAFKNDVQFWRSRKSLEGLSVRSVFFNVFQSFIVLLYIMDNETNTMVIVMVFIGMCIDIWKVTKVTTITLDRDNLIAGIIPRLSFVDSPSYVESSTKKYDKLAFKYLGWVLFPLFICYAVYSLLYQEHKGWYSFLLGLGYGFLLTFGFITMTPQLFINYKLKSVAHLPWRMLSYKALNTFIDDMFAFVIKMPTMYRIGCFRDDIVFFIYLYQRWIYRVDPKRINEFGTSGEDELQQQQNGQKQSQDGTESSDVPIKSAEEKKKD